MRFITLCFVSCLLLINDVTADSWQKIYGGSQNEVSAGIASASENGFVVAGFTQSSGAGKRDIWIVRFFSNGDVLWEKTYGTSADEIATSIARSPSGGFIITGHEAVPAQTPTRPFLLRIDDLGHIVWQKNFGATNFLIPTSVTVSPEGHIIVAGVHEQVHSGAWICKLTASGEILWQKKIGGNQQFLNTLQSIRTTVDNEIIIAGSRLGVTIGNQLRQSEIWIARLSKSGNIRWQNRYGVEDRGDFGWDIFQTLNGDFVVAASQGNPTTASEDLIILRLNSSGAIQWQKRFETNHNEDVRSIAEAPNGNIFVGGQTEFGIRDSALLLELSATGELLNQRQFLNANFINAGLLFQSDGGLIAAGHSRSFQGKLADFWVLSLTSPFDTGTCNQRVSSLATSDGDFAANPTFHTPRNTNLRLLNGIFVERDTRLARRVICSRKP